MEILDFVGSRSKALTEVLTLRQTVVESVLHICQEGICLHLFFFFKGVGGTLGIEPRLLHIPGKHSVTELCPRAPRDAL